MPIPISDLQSVSPSAVIELFELQLDLALHGSSTIYRFHAGASLNATGQITWNGNAYTRYPVTAEGFEYTGNGQLPQPKLRVSNVEGNITTILQLVNATTAGNDLIGAKIVRIRTLARYLDSVNFPPRRNLFTQTDGFNTANWSKTRTSVLANVTLDPFGELTPDELVDDSTPSSTHSIFQSVNGLAGGTSYTFSIYAQASGRDFIRLDIPSGGAFSSARSAVIDLVSGQVVSTAGSILSATAGKVVTDDTNSRTWVRAAMKVTTDSSGTGTFEVYLQQTAGSNVYSGGGSSFGVILAAAQLEAGDLGEYQPIGATFSQNPLGTPDPTVEFPQEIYYISQKTIENRDAVEFTLAAAFDLEGVRAPKRQCIGNICQWQYRSSDCGYSGTAYFDENDASVGSLAQDVCGKRISSCRIRFAGATNIAIGGNSDRINSGASLTSGNKLVSPNGWYQLIMQTDGNLVLYTKGNEVLWSTSTNLSGSCYAIMETNGEFRVRATVGGAVQWTSGTPGSGGTRVQLQNDGNLVMFTTSNVPVWDTGTNRSGEPGNPSAWLPYGSFPGIGTVIL